MKKIMKITLVIILLVFVATQLLSRNTSSKTETPKYELVDTIKLVEIRKYPNLVMATTSMGSNGYSKESGNGFRTVASYIFGGNERSEKISMTSPVMVEMSDTIKMSFIMPSVYHLDELPNPDNPQVVLHEQDAKVLAVIRYGGFSNEQRFESYKAILADLLDKENIKTVGPYMFFGYNPPYEVLDRRNEVAVEIMWEK